IPAGTGSKFYKDIDIEVDEPLPLFTTPAEEAGEEIENGEEILIEEN
ncbi:MAG: hypothetical protein HQ583_05210, partial [Candidatus Abyssubacteria bacterium]|nr:hypothetical protein [Candidatus Abyssubacteria bacterium]